MYTQSTDHWYRKRKKVKVINTNRNRNCLTENKLRIIVGYQPTIYHLYKSINMEVTALRGIIIKKLYFLEISEKMWKIVHFIYIHIIYIMNKYTQ